MNAAPRGRALFLVNPEAGGGQATLRLGSLLRAVRPLGGRYEVATVHSLEDTCRAVGTLAPGVVVVAAGGDGTVALVAAALQRTGVGGTVTAIVPLGTGNILACELGVGNPREALRALERGAVRRVDVMRTSHPEAPVALVSISGGFEGRFLGRYASLRRYGRPVAALGALATSLGGGAPISLEADGEAVLRHDAAFSAGLYNTRRYIGGLLMSPEADLADGAGEGIVYRTARAYCATLGAALCGASRRPVANVVRRRWRSARIESAGPLQIDGEPVPGGAISAWMEPGALAVIAGADP